MVARQAHNQSPAGKNVRAHVTRYTKEEKIRAVTILAHMGGLSSASHAQVNKILNKEVKYYTLAHWQTLFKSEVINIVPDLKPKDDIDTAKLIADTQRELVVSLASVASKATKHLNQDKVIDAMAGRDAAVVAGIASEKMLLMAGHNTAAMEKFKQLEQECVGTRYHPMDLLDDLINGVRHAKQIQNNNLLESTNE